MKWSFSVNINGDFTTFTCTWTSRSFDIHTTWAAAASKAHSHEWAATSVQHLCSERDNNSYSVLLLTITSIHSHAEDGSSIYQDCLTEFKPSLIVVWRDPWYQLTVMILAIGLFRLLQSSSSRALAVFLLLICASTSARAALGDDEKEEILSAHNYYRSIVDPIATNMQKMVS